MQFANPIWLWGLTGLLVPIGIHLLSRKEGKVIKIGSIRHLQESSTKQSISLRLDELILLTMRCLLITLIVLLLSGLDFQSDQTKSERWVVIERGLENDVEFTSLIDSLRKQGFHIRRLDERFPAINNSKTNTRINYWRLMEALKTKSLKQVVVLSYTYTEGFKGKRISMPTDLVWISKSPPPTEFYLKAVKIAVDSVSVRMGNSNADETTFENLIAPLNPNQSYINSAPGKDSIQIQSPDTLTITIVSDLEFENEKEIVLAALHAIEETIPVIFNFKMLQPDQWRSDEKTDWMIWLSDKLNGNTIHTNRIIFTEDATKKNTPMLEPAKISLSEGATWLLTKRLNEEIALQEKLPLKLASLIVSKKESERRAAEFDRRVQPEKMVWSREEQANTEKLIADTNITNATQFLVILILISLFVERLIAFKRNQ